MKKGHEVAGNVVFKEVASLRGRLEALQHRVQVLGVRRARQLRENGAEVWYERGKGNSFLPALDVVDEAAEQRRRLAADALGRVRQAAAQELLGLAGAGHQDLPDGDGHLLHRPEAVRADAAVLAGVGDRPHQHGHELGPLWRVGGPLVVHDVDDLVAQALHAVGHLPADLRLRLCLQHPQQAGSHVRLAGRAEPGPHGAVLPRLAQALPQEHGALLARRLPHFRRLQHLEEASDGGGGLLRPGLAVALLCRVPESVVAAERVGHRL
mmetsp:Transcript_14148/g.40151  ORF Transcript_14148/g.40151 Transcript_14148/m.40151 type:complete len:267 (+) Transcript_14148:2649-3449(+)